jgi:hypothetical protein
VGKPVASGLFASIKVLLELNKVAHVMEVGIMVGSQNAIIVNMPPLRHVHIYWVIE